MAQAIPFALMAAGSLLSAGGSIIGANAEAKEMRMQADQLEANAGLERASSQRAAMDEKRSARLTASRALAVAAASGGGADDPTVVNTIAGIEGEGEYRALTALYNGDQQAEGMEAEAKARRRGAKSTKTAGLLKAGSTILSGASSIYGKYG